MRRTKKAEIKQITIATRITEPMLEMLKEYLSRNAHVSISDYLRDLVRRDLESKGFVLYKRDTRVKLK